MQPMYHSSIFAYAIIGIYRVTSLRSHVVHGIVTPVIRRASLTGGDSRLLLLSVRWICRKARRNNPCGFVFIHTREVEGRQDMNCLETIGSQRAKMLHAVGV